MLITTKGTDHYTTTAVVRGAAIAQWIRLLFPFCRPGFESQAHHLRCHRFIKLCSVEKTKINQKGGRDLPILKNNAYRVSQRLLYSLRLVHTTLQICRNLQQMVVFLQGDRKFSILAHCSPLQQLQLVWTSLTATRLGKEHSLSLR